MIYERKKQLGLLDDTLVGSVYNNYVNNGNSRTNLATAGGINNERVNALKNEYNNNRALQAKYRSAEEYANFVLSQQSGSKGNLVDRTHVGRGKTTFKYPPSHMNPNYVPKNKMGKDYEFATSDDIAKGNFIELKDGTKIVTPGTSAEALAKRPDALDLKGDYGSDLKKHHGGNEQDQQKWWHQLAGKMGLDFDKAAANWKEKGGFEGLMANPAFTMGLAFMQAGAEGKTIGQGALDNVMKAGGISQHYKKILEDRKQEPIQVTAEDMDDVKGLLKAIGIEEGNIFEKVWSRVTGQGNQQVKFDLAVHEIAAQFQKEVRDWQAKNVDAQGNPKIIRPEDKIKILRELIKNKKVKYKKSIFDVIGMSSTIEKEIPPITPKAEGGPVQAGRPYVVGEEGPEVIIPHSSGNVLSNDDSQIYAMLLAANPQLQKVSKTRAERILRSRFPEYFE